MIFSKKHYYPLMIFSSHRDPIYLQLALKYHITKKETLNNKIIMVSRNKN